MDASRASLLTVSFSRSPLPVSGWSRSPSADVGHYFDGASVIATGRSYFGLKITRNSIEVAATRRDRVRPKSNDLPWASDIRRATENTAAVTTTSCLCDIRMTISSRCCRRCLKRRQSSRAINPPRQGLPNVVWLAKENARLRALAVGYIESARRPARSPVAGCRPILPQQGVTTVTAVTDPRGHWFRAKRAAPAIGASHFTA